MPSRGTRIHEMFILERIQFKCVREGMNKKRNSRGIGESARIGETTSGLSFVRWRRRFGAKKRRGSERERTHAHTTRARSLLTDGSTAQVGSP